MKQRGFTLLETLIALVLMSLLMVALFGGFRAGIASWRVADSYIEQTEPQLMVSRMLYRHLSQVRVFQAVPPGNESSTFLGQAHLVRYVAPLAQSVDDQLYVIELTNRPAGEPGVWIKYVPFATLETIEEQLAQAEYQRVNAELELGFSYFFDNEWLDELEPGAVPDLVRVHWQSGERVWSDAVFVVTRG